MSVGWAPLQKGDVIDVVAPGSGFDKSELLKSIAVLEQKGFKPRFDEKILDPYLFHSSPDKERFAMLKAALFAKDSKAIWCFRGGYGSNRLIPALLKLRRPSKSKVVIGISDISSLHNFLVQKWRWPVLHASLLDRLGNGQLPELLLLELMHILSGEQLQVTFKAVKPMNERAAKVKRKKAPVVGGNLMTLQSTLGTACALSARGKFLFFEELNERGYRVDRMLEHFSQCGVIKACEGVLLGHFIGGEEPGGKPSRVGEALQRFADTAPVPVWSGVQSGHDKELKTLPLGTSAVISRIENNEFYLEVETGAQ